MTALRSESGISAERPVGAVLVGEELRELLAVAVVDHRGLVAPLRFALGIGKVANDGRVDDGTGQSQRERQDEGAMPTNFRTRRRRVR
jgi:hypothetical protein